ncbi:MAG: UDP-N-acetylmuramoyl-L-alanyl-D-glutamate--2,6-diaminopimelate ligase [Clostridia bacterium]|nr:UDP-N-acetylmuramoyl-L-alanyl-D-glutamate--2,6-diaminopimelate ligase [Clostridia bacterium]
MLLKELINGLSFVKTRGSLDVEIEGIAYDSRNVRQGFIFVCIEGFSTDGHEYIPMAIENGAKALLVQKDIEAPDGITVIKVNNTRYAIAYISDIFFGHPSRKLALTGVTGTKGKTTTTFMIKSILEAANQKVGLIGTLGTRIGDLALASERTTPEAYDLQSVFAQMAEKDVKSVVMEVSSQGLELHRVSCVDFDTGIFTNLSQDHISPREHSSMEEYFNAKLKLFKMCRTGIINKDHPYGREVIKKASCKIYTYGIEQDADIKADNIVLKQDSVEFDVNTPWGVSRISVGVPGKFSIYNALAAIGAAGVMGVPLAAAAEGLKKISVPGRAEVIYSDERITVITDYAHTPDSLENILTTFKNSSEGRVVCVFGCGGDRDRNKRPLMGEVSGRIADFTIITSDNPRTEEPMAIIKDIEEGIKKLKAEYLTIEDRRQAIKYSIENAQPKDVIILAGKGHETYQIFKDKTVHFDEREVVREIIRELEDKGC